MINMKKTDHTKKTSLEQQGKEVEEEKGKERSKKGGGGGEGGGGGHKGISWATVQARLETHTEKVWSLNEMENSGGEPDVIGYDKKTGEYIFFDCSAQSPGGRRSVCYDAEALASRKEHKPKNSAVEMAAAMGIEILTEEQYRQLQQLGEFDTKTSSWVKTPGDIR